jgi:carboxypeptidase C (cathepsin A)
MRQTSPATILLLCAFSLVPAAAQQPSRPAQPSAQQPQQRPAQPPPARRDEPGGQAPDRREVATADEDKRIQTPHTVRINGRELRYTATAGTLPVRDEEGKLAARVFFVAYTKDGEDAKTRPVSFLYNGGPGSATIWLHMGSFAPKRVQMADEGFQPAPPYRLVDNENTLLEASDLVFVDAISTGYSRTVSGVNPSQFHGQQGDLRAFGSFIYEYLRTYDRWPSPKYLIGESYGTIRSAGLSQELQTRHGIELNGIVLVSALLTYQTIATSPQNDVALVSYFPTYTATAWFHKKLPADLSTDLGKALDEARAFATGEYATTLLKGNSLTAPERRTVAQKIARLTGLSVEYVERANLRIDPGRFRKELLRDKRLVVGRLDSRFTATDLDAAGETQEFDPSNTALQGAYTAAFSDYVKNELKWETDLHYDTSGNVRPWTYDQNRYMDMTEPLRSAMARNPFLKVLVVAGYYDMATPFLGVEINFWHLGYDPTFTRRVQFTYYEGGHMMYIRPSAHKALTADVARFIRESGPATRTSTQQ